MGRFSIFTQYNKDEDEEKKIKPSQVASEEQKKKRFSIFTEYNDIKKPEEPKRPEPPKPSEVKKEEEKKPKSFVEKAKEFFTDLFKKEETEDKSKRSRVLDFITGVAGGGVLLPDPDREDVIIKGIAAGLGDPVSGLIDYTTRLIEEVEQEAINKTLDFTGSIVRSPFLSPKQKTEEKASTPPLEGGLSEKTREVSKKIKLWSDELSPENPDFLDHLARGTGSMFAFTAVSLVTGGSVIAPVVIESVVEAGSVYETNREAGLSIEESGNKANVTLALNLILNSALNVFDIDVEDGKIFAKFLKGVKFESLQEGAQQIISNASTGRPIMEGVFLSMGVGGFLGGGTAVVLPTGRRGTDKEYKAKEETSDFTPVEAEVIEEIAKKVVIKPKAREEVEAGVEEKKPTKEIADVVKEKKEALEPTREGIDITKVVLNPKKTTSPEGTQFFDIKRSGENVGQIETQKETFGKDDLLINFIEVVPGVRRTGIATEALKNVVKDTQVKTISSEPTNLIAYESLKKAFGEPIEISDNISDITEEELLKRLPKTAEFLRSGEIDSSKRVFVRFNNPNVLKPKVAKKPTVKQISDEAYKQTVKSGGVTISLAGKKPKKGIAYAPFKGTETVVDKADFNEDVVEKYVQKHLNKLKEEGNHLGLWEDEGKIYLDISNVGEGTPETFERAMSAEQLAVFDLESFEDIKLGKIDKGKYNRLYDKAINHPYFDKRKVTKAGDEGVIEKPQKVSKEVSKEVKPKVRPTAKKGKGGIFDRTFEELKLTTNVEDNFDSITLRDQADKATTFMEKNPEDAVAISFRQKPPPKGIRFEAINIATSEQALANGDLQLFSDLIAARSIIQARNAQGLGLERLVNSLSTSSFVKQVMRTRIQKLSTQKGFKSRFKAANKKGGKISVGLDIVTETSDKAKIKVDNKVKSGFKSAQSIIDSITCV